MIKGTHAAAAYWFWLEWAAMDENKTVNPSQKFGSLSDMKEAGEKPTRLA